MRGPLAKSRDTPLLGEVHILEEAMRTRYGEKWHKFLDRVKKAPDEPVSLSLEVMDPPQLLHTD